MSSPDSESPVLSVVTVTFNSADEIAECIRSVAEGAGRLSVEHILIDNASNDDTAKIVKGQFPEVRFVENDVNRGLTQANNQGKDLTRGRYIVFLNPDTKVTAGSFETMAAIMDGNPSIGVLAPRLVNEHGEFLRGIMGHRTASARTLINGYWLLSRLSQDLFPGVHRTRDVQGLVDCDWACGACLMVRREVADQFSWRRFGSGDDFDYCIQIHEAGWRIALTGDAQVAHFDGRSFTLIKPGTWEGTPSNFALYLRERRSTIHTLVAIVGMRLGLHVRGTVHYLLYLLTRDPERLYKVNKVRHFLAHDDYCVFRGGGKPTPTSYPT